MLATQNILKTLTKNSKRTNYTKASESENTRPLVFR